MQSLVHTNASVPLVVLHTFVILFRFPVGLLLYFQWILNMGPEK